jgi:putative component of toxin-antitoxin plasmid stabilization module
VTDFISAKAAEKPYIAGKYEHNGDGYQIMLDQREHNIIVSLYYGSKIKSEDEEEETESLANTIE